MIFRVIMKCPDALEDVIGYGAYDIIDEDQRDLEVASAKHFANAWVKYGEYVTIEFDTEKKTCVVVKP